ncbi:hypothetical protein CRG98_013026 [Punica granatum]|uniref:UDP-glycosyltransferase 87A1-like n=1 Tax=Punica granatum TaxID=22663 RepID=A0A2I0KDI7_PUNGR|nr:hypothetical protein CRG98_013026 [Punica granatum]
MAPPTIGALDERELSLQPEALVCHMLALPYPGRGHINPMLSLCELLLSKEPRIHITFVLTEEWLSLITSAGSNKPCSSNYSNNIRFVTLPNIIPSELDRSKDFPGFFEAVDTKMEGPFEQLLDALAKPPAVIVADTFLKWAVGVGKRRNIPVASLWTQSASVFSLLQNIELLEQNGDFQVDLLGDGHKVLHKAIKCISMASKAQFFLSTSFHELEPLAIKALRPIFSSPIYSVGPTIPFSKLKPGVSEEEADDLYLQWLDSQPSRSILYVSLGGSFLSVSSAQLEEIIAGVRDSGARSLWVARGNTSFIRDAIGDRVPNLVVPWCNQLKVLCHDSVGGFWTHCGWNSTLEAIFSGVPMLTCPIFWDQIHNSKQIVKDWKIGFRVKKKSGSGDVIMREEIAGLVKKLMDPESEEGREVRRRVKELQQCCAKAIARGSGSSDIDLDAFVRDIYISNKTRRSEN